MVSSGLVFNIGYFQTGVNVFPQRWSPTETSLKRFPGLEGNMYRDWKRPIRPVLIFDHHFMAGFLRSTVTSDPNLRGNAVCECGNWVPSQWGEGGMRWHLWDWKKVLSLLAPCQVGGGDSWLPRTLSLRTSLDDVIINVSRIISIINYDWTPGNLNSQASSINSYN